MNTMLITFLCKIADNALSTLKNIFLHKQRYFISSLFSASGTFFYMVAMVNAIKDNSFSSILAMCVATFLGSYIPAKIVEKKEPDKLYVFDITTNDIKEGLLFADSIRELNIPIKTAPAYNELGNKVIECKVFCGTKQESAILKELIKDSYKYHAYESKEH